MTGCTLCDLEVPDPPVTAGDVDGEFCCQGCLQVARALDDVDVEDADPEDLLDSADAEEADGEVAYLSVDGMHCSTCEVFLESTTTDHQGVNGAAASYATDTMKVVYDPDEVAENDLPDIVSGAGYEAREQAVDTEPENEDAQVARFLAGGGFFGMMTMMWYVLFIYPQHFGFDPVVEFGFFGRAYLLGQIWLFSSAVLFYTGWPLLRGAYVSLRAGQPNMDLLVALAATSAYVYSTAVTLTGGIDVYFDVTVAIVLVVTAGNYYEDRVKRSAIRLLSDLTAERVSEARTRDGETVPVEEVDPGTELLVRPGERVPLDGTVEEGVAAVDEALVTGESLPVTKRPGDEVVGGGVVTDTPLVVAVSEEGTSTLDRIVGMLWDIQSSRPGVQKLADKLATVFVPLVTVLAVLTAGATLALGGSVTSAILVGLTVLIVSCPCALGLATPLAVAAGVQRAAEEGIVVASDTLFETLPETDVVALDKTGTLTSGTMTVTEVDGDTEVLARAAALERYSNHPVADAIVAHAAEEREDPTAGLSVGGSDAAADGGTQALDSETVDAGDSPVAVETKGVVGRVEDAETVVGHPDLFAERGWEVPAEYRERAAEATAAGAVPVLVGWDGAVRGLLVVSDEPRASWDETVTTLAAEDRDVVVLTGDDSAAAEQFRDHPDVDEVFTGVPPDGKVAAIQRLQERGRVAMVGDGANDAPALAAADVGIAIAQGTKLAAEAADAVVTSGRLDAVPTLFDVAGGTKRRVRQNLGWAFGYNAVAIPLAAAGMLNPLFAALAMTASSTLVVLNSSRSVVPSE
ncbi:MULTISPECIES: heavy metal translocating P-type ATPase [Salinibaculum]|uniref:heavy metal translocating P-type ATPase n=1 Tax=Salinibaculum TaxID=2732368 RepID=UPI0030D5878A